MTSQLAISNQVLLSGYYEQLQWDDEKGVGSLLIEPIDYSGGYFQHYQMLDNTIMGRELTNARKSLVDRYTDSVPVDIGIGGGAFISKMNCYGYDVGAEAIEYLMTENRYVDVYRQKVESITCWDSLEHIPDPSLLINQVTGWVFVSMPVYLNKEDCLRSKHFKPGEHLWYWTTYGLIDWFNSLGFECLEVNNIETDIGREGITSFVFKRVKDG